MENKRGYEKESAFNKKINKLKWIAEFLEYELEGRSAEEQKAFLEEFKLQATKLLEKI